MDAQELVASVVSVTNLSEQEIGVLKSFQRDELWRSIGELQLRESQLIILSVLVRKKLVAVNAHSGINYYKMTSTGSAYLDEVLLREGYDYSS